MKIHARSLEIDEIQTAKTIVEMLLAANARKDIRDHKKKFALDLFAVKETVLRNIEDDVPGLMALKERLRVPVCQEEVSAAGEAAAAGETSGDTSASLDRANSPTQISENFEQRIQSIIYQLLPGSDEVRVESFDSQNILENYH